MYNMCIYLKTISQSLHSQIYSNYIYIYREETNLMSFKGRGCDNGNS